MIAERVDNNRRPRGTRTNENERCKPTKQGGVRKLEHGTHYSESNGAWVAQVEFISMVDVRWMEKVIKNHYCGVGTGEPTYPKI